MVSGRSQRLHMCARCRASATLWETHLSKATQLHDCLKLFKSPDIDLARHNTASYNVIGSGRVYLMLKFITVHSLRQDS